MHERTPIILLILCTSLFLSALSATACQICIPFPKKSAADYLIEAETVVLAREDTARPFHFAPVETLKGDPPGDEKIDLFLDSTTRRVLATHPDRSIVLSKMTEGEKQSWKRIGTADADLGPIVREILATSVAWEKEPKKRVAFFAEQLGHGNAQVRALAHLEIARAPYSEIRNCAGILDRQEIRAFLNNMRYVEWHPLYILLLARSDNPADQALISDSFESAARFGSTLRLAAWATGLIEIQEQEAVIEIEARYFRNPSRKPEELKAVHQALSVHGTNGHVHLRDRIVASYETLLAHYPAMTPDVAKDLIAWKRTELADEIAAYAAANRGSLGFQTTLKLRAYARKTKEK